MFRSLFNLHYVSILAVIGSFLGSVLMFLIGIVHVIEAFLLFFGLEYAHVPGKENVEAVATILESFDNFLLGFILLYFAYSLFFLTTFPEKRERWFGQVSMPPALEVASLGEMKRTILVVIVVSLSVFLLREILISAEQFHSSSLLVPISIVSIAVALKLIKFEN